MLFIRATAIAPQNAASPPGEDLLAIASQARQSSQPRAAPLPSSVSVANITFHAGRVMTVLSEVEQRILSSAFHPETPKEAIGELSENLFLTYAIGAKDNYRSRHLPPELPSQVLVTCAVDLFMNLNRVIIADPKGRIYCDARFEPPATPSWVLEQQAALPVMATALPPGLSVRTASGPPQTRANKRREASEGQVREQLLKPDGTMRTTQEVVAALRANGLGGRPARINKLLQKAGGVIGRTSGSDPQIREQPEKPDGTPTSEQAVAVALQATGFVGWAADNTQSQGAGGVVARTPATDDQIRAQLWNSDHTPRGVIAIAGALHALGLGAGKLRIATQLRAVRDPTVRPSASDSQLRERLRNPNGEPRSVLAVKDALHASGLGASNNRITKELQSLRGVIHRTSASDDQVAAQLISPGGRVRSLQAVSDALHGAGMGASSFRILASLQELRDKQLQPLPSDD